MSEELQRRVLSVAEHIYNTHDTIRKTALLFNFSKSTIHNDVSVKLKKLDYSLYEAIRQILNENFAEKHIRGGAATKKKYLSENITNN